MQLAIVALLSAVPHLLFAQASNLQGVFTIFGTIIGTIIPVIVALALLYFFWGLAKFILNADNEQARSDGKQIMVWGIIALFVIVSVWGLVAVLNRTFVNSRSAPDIESLVPGGSGGGFSLIDLIF